MVKSCIYGLCKNSSRNADQPHMTGVRFISFPKPTTPIATEKAKRWISACRREGFGLENIKPWTYVCSTHFVHPGGPTSLNPDPVPATSSKVNKHRMPRLDMTQVRKRALQHAKNKVSTNATHREDKIRNPEPDKNPATATETDKDLVTKMEDHSVAETDTKERYNPIVEIERIPAIEIFKYSNTKPEENLVIATQISTTINTNEETIAATGANSPITILTNSESNETTPGNAGNVLDNYSQQSISAFKFIDALFQRTSFWYSQWFPKHDVFYVKLLHVWDEGNSVTAVIHEEKDNFMVKFCLNGSDLTEDSPLVTNLKTSVEKLSVKNTEHGIDGVTLLLKAVEDWQFQEIRCLEM